MRRVQWAARLLWMLLTPLLAYLFVVELVFCAWGFAGHEADLRSELILTAAGAAMSLFPLGFWYRQERKGKFRQSPESHGRLRLVVCSIAAGAGACLFFNGVLSLLPFSLEGYHRVRRVLYQPPPAVQLICMGLVIPAGEELVFRGLGYGRIRDELSVREATAVSALWFGLYHGNLPQGIYAGLLGTIAAALYEAGDCLWLCWLFHGTANVTAIAGTLLGGGEGFLLSAEGKLASVVLGGILLLFCNEIRRDGK